METPLGEITTEAARVEKKKLRKGLRYFDMIFYIIVATINLSFLGAFAANGAQAFTWLLISAVTFFLPYGLLTAELGSSFPQEGGIYAWCKVAGGRLFASLAATLYWIPIPLWVGGVFAVNVMVIIKTFWFGNANELFGGSRVTDTLISIAVGLLLIWAIVWATTIPLRYGKWFARIGSYLKLSLLALFILLTVFFVAGGFSRGVHAGIADLIPSNGGLIVSGILPLIILLWTGGELQNSAAEEMDDARRDVPRSLLRAGIMVAIAYSLFLLAILIALPRNRLSIAGSFFDAFQVVNGVLPAPLARGLGWVVALGLISAMFCAGGVTWLIGVNRTYAIAALDRSAPLLLGRFSRKYGTPIAVNFLSGITATITLVAAYGFAALGSESIGTLFTQALGLVISTGILSYLFLIPTLLILRYRYPAVPRRFRVPGGMVGAWIVTLLPMTYACIACYFLLIPGDTYLKQVNVDRPTYELTHFVPLACIVLLAIVLYVWGQRERHNRDVPVEFDQESLTGG